MTRPSSRSALVLEGSEVKLRLEAERVESASFVHVDWVRFTCLLRKAPGLDMVDAVWASPVENSWDETDRMACLVSVLRRLPDADFAAGVQAGVLAGEVCEALGADFKVAPEPAKGHDFYRYRLPIFRNDVECGWVGYLASGDSPRQSAQGQTLHVNLYGAACTFAAPGWRLRLADLVDARDANITRVDLALDFFDGLPGGMAGVLADFESGACDVGGKRLTCNMLGDWSSNGGARSFYLGSKEAGKQTNVYEKGDQLFGRDGGSEWVRIELRYGNKLRVLPSDLLRRPDDFFSGASEWHLGKLAILQSVFAAQKVPCLPRLPLETVDAEVSRNLRWARNTAAPTIAAAFVNLGYEFLELVTAKRLPGRLAKFSPAEVKAAFLRVASSVLPAGGVCPSSGGLPSWA